MPVTNDIFFVHCICNIELKQEHVNGGRRLLQETVLSGNVFTTIVGSAINNGIDEDVDAKKKDETDASLILVLVIILLVLLIVIGGVSAFIFKRKKTESSNYNSVEMREKAAVSIVSHKRNDTSMEMARVTNADDESKETFTIKYNDDNDNIN